MAERFSFAPTTREADDPKSCAPRALHDRFEVVNGALFSFAEHDDGSASPES
jgi:hypothetical protein